MKLTVTTVDTSTEDEDGENDDSDAAVREEGRDPGRKEGKKREEGGRQRFDLGREM